MIDYYVFDVVGGELESWIGCCGVGCGMYVEEY